MGCICSQTTKNSDMNTAPDYSVKPISAFNDEIPNIDNDHEVKENQKQINHQLIDKIEDNKDTDTDVVSTNKNTKVKLIVEPLPPQNENNNALEESINQSKIKKKKRKFDIEIIEMINNFRQKPNSVIEKLKAMIGNIKVFNNKLIYHKKGQPRIVMNTGEEAILSTISFISSLPQMAKLEVRKEIAINLPPNPDHWTSRFSNLVEEKTAELKKKAGIKYSTLSFHFDLSITDPETSLLLQLVDDNSFKGSRRMHICDPEMKYIAVTYSSISSANSDISGEGNEIKKKDKKFCSYFTFAK